MRSLLPQGTLVGTQKIRQVLCMDVYVCGCGWCGGVWVVYVCMVAGKEGYLWGESQGVTP